MAIPELLQRIFSPKDGSLCVYPAKKLLHPHRQIIAEIKAIVGLPPQYWDFYYLKTLYNLAEYIQELPASEAHHHSQKGGLLEHTLETSLNALRIRRGKLLPPNADAETVTRLKDIWTYALFTASLCHDLGKPITDVDIELFDKDKKQIGQWRPFSGSMKSVAGKGAKTYRVQYRRNRIYASHGRASALYIHHIIPSAGLDWLVSDQDVFYYWTNMLTGHEEDAGLIGSIIHEADKLSVASNLAGDQYSSEPAATSNRKPLYKRIITSLRFQLDEGMLPLNRDGAAGWIKEDKLWVVVKRALDQVRDHMTQEGQTGIPSRNDRVMDELQQYSVLIPNGDKAVWRCQVFDQEWPKAHELTLLCIPVDKIWSSADAVPAHFNGTIKPIGQENQESTETQNNQNRTTEGQEPNINEGIPGHNSADPENQKPLSSSTPQEHVTGTEAQEVTEKPQRAIQPPSIDFNSLASPSDSLNNDVTNEESKLKDQTDQQTTQKNRKLESNTTNSQTHDESSPGVQPNTQAGEQILHWLREGLHQRKFKVNDVNSKIHMTKEGLLLVSPAIFKQFDKAKWSYVQKRFTKLKLHERNSNGTNIHEYLASGRKKKSLIKGFLITDTANVFPGIELPKTNHSLSKVEN